MDGTGSAGPAQPAPACAAATVLLGIRGLLVTAVTETPDGQTLVEVITDLAFEAARCCPRCGKAATRVKERPRTAPRDVFTGDRQVLLDWRKTRWHCDTPGCEQVTFTEWLPAVKRRARLTSRLRTCLGEAVGDDLTPAAAVARRYGVSDRTAARAFTAYADEQLAGLDEQQGPVQAAGAGEFRRGAPADRTDPETGEVTRTRSEWLTHLVDLDSGGTLGLAEGRTAAAEKDLLAGHAATLRYLAMDLSATYRSGAPAGVTLVADAFHLIKLANRKIDDAFRRLGYRTQHAHEELGLPRPLHYMLRCNIENLDPGHLATIIGVLDADADGQQIAAAWIAKEHLRDLLALRATRTHVTPRAQRGPRQARQLLHLVRGQRQRPRDKNPRQDNKQMAAARHRRRIDGLFERSGFTLHLMLMIRFLEGYSFILLPECFPKVTLVTGLEKFYPHFHSPR